MSLPVAFKYLRSCPFCGSTKIEKTGNANVRCNSCNLNFQVHHAYSAQPDRTIRQNIVDIKEHAKKRNKWKRIKYLVKKFFKL